jgi:cell wall-associated NlpC family hydrolase
LLLYFFSVFITLILSVARRFARLTCLFLITAMLLGGMPARPARAEINMPSTTAGALIEGDQVGPPALVYDQGKFYVLDSPNNRIAVLDPHTGERRDIALPGGYFADMLIKDHTIYLRDFNRPGLLALDEATGQGVPANLSSLVSPAAADLSILSDFSVTSQRGDDHQGTLTIYDAHKIQLAVLAIQSEDYLGSARLLGRDDAGNYYVMVEELLENVPAMLVDTSIRRYAADGTFIDAARLPMPEIAYFPNRPVAIDPQGGAYFLKVTQNQADVVQLDFSAATPSPLEERWGTLQESAQYKNDLQKKTGQVPHSALPITRQQIIRNAKSFLNVNWTMKSANYHSGQASNWDNCDSSKENWRLPRTLTGRVGQTIAEVPYAWGGYASVAQFRSQIKRGDWAGNICENQVLDNAAGVDCAGYVSQVLQIGGYYLADDSDLGRVSTAVDWSELAPGDLLLKSGSHVMLFDAFANAQTLDGGVWVYESTMRNGADRVGHNLVSFSILSGYSPRRYNNVVDGRLSPYLNTIRNGDFAAGEAEWGYKGEVDKLLLGGRLYIKPHASTPNGVAVYQDINAVAAAGSPLEVVASLGNASRAAAQVTLSLRNPNILTGALACSFTIPANAEPQTYRLAGVLPKDWQNTRFELSLAAAGGLPDVSLDNVSVSYRPDLSPVGVECTVGEAPPAYSGWVDPYYGGAGWVIINGVRVAMGR